jgi:hypothetical protein
MKRILSFSLVSILVFLLSVPIFANDGEILLINNYTSIEKGIEVEESLNRNLTKEDGYKFEFIGIKSISNLDANSKFIVQGEKQLYGFRIVSTNLDGAYVNEDGVRVRTRPSLSSTIKGLLYSGDIVWFDPFERDTYADGYYWRYVFTDSQSNMGEDEGYMTTNYIGREV